MIFFLRLFFLLFLPLRLLSAEVEVIDNGKVFERLKDFSAGLDFSSSFTCNTSEKFLSTVTKCSYKCDDMWCMNQCDPQKSGTKVDEYYVEDCSADQVHIYGQNGFEAIITRSEYEQAGNNWLIGLLKAHGQFIQPVGRIEVESSFFVFVDVFANGKKTQVRGEKIFATVFEGTSKKGYGIEVILLPNEKGLRQIAYFRGGTDEDFMHLIGTNEFVFGKK